MMPYMLTLDCACVAPVKAADKANANNNFFMLEIFLLKECRVITQHVI
jgi:hypothetical protein